MAAAGGVRLGGAQELAVHTLPGGTRVIDAMGPDDAEIIWRGILIGSDAANRARLLDTMRSAGSEIQLSWDSFTYNVVISTLTLNYANQFLIHYEIRCTVVTVARASVAAPSVSTESSISADLNTASIGWNVTNIVIAVQTAGSLIRGTQAYAVACNTIASSKIQLEGEIALTEKAIFASDAFDISSLAGSLASLTAAQSYLGRAQVNLMGGIP